MNGTPCDGGICVLGQCCAVNLACGDVCCAEGQVCSFQKCENPGSNCANSSDCPKGQYCEQPLGDVSDGGVPDPDAGSCMGGGGAAAAIGQCLPKPPQCPPGTPDPAPGEPVACLNQCQYKPPPSVFAPELKYAWGGQLAAPYATDVMMTPIVIQLDDDDCDGKVTDKDIPEIVFTTFSDGMYNAPGVLHVMSIMNGQIVEKWSVDDIDAAAQIAAGNIDGIPGNEIVACGTIGSVRAYTATGSLLWSTMQLVCVMPSIADLQGDGAPEVIGDAFILDGATGNVKTFLDPLPAGLPIVSDIDGDGVLDIVTASQGYRVDGSLFVDTGLANQGSGGLTPGGKVPTAGVADLDLDGKVEVIAVDNLNHALSVWRYNAALPAKFEVVRAPVDINGSLSPSLCPVGSWGNTHGGGPPTIADFNGDGTPDVAVAGGVGYAVFDGKKLVDPTVAGPNTLLWIRPIVDCSSASTSSTVFDFDGDGKVEAVYADQERLRIYEGPTGNVLWDTCNTSATISENPIVADVDNDGHADVVVGSNGYDPGILCNDGVNTRQSGLRIFGDAMGNWVRTRSIWNQHSYHITNVEDDGSIPVKEPANYLVPGLNNFRQNKQLGLEFSAPDAIVSIAPNCSGEYGLVATVRNIGEAALPAGVVVSFYSGAPSGGVQLGTGMTTKVLYPAESEAVLLPFPNAPDPVKNGATPIYAVVDDTGVPHLAWTECRVDNNASTAGSGLCSMPK